MRTAGMGECELLGLMSILRQSEEPYAKRVRADEGAHAERKVTRGALYRTLDRLTENGFVTWELEASEIPDRGGHPMRRLRVTPEGLAAAPRSRESMRPCVSGRDPLGDPA